MLRGKISEGRNMKPFRFGVNVRLSRSRAEWVAKARKIEELGYDVLTVPDHLTELFAPMPAMISAAEATTHLRVGTNVLNNDLRHPVLVAREAATVDLLTDGRLQLGLGAGSIRSEYDQAGWASIAALSGSSGWQRRAPSTKGRSKSRRSTPRG